MKKLEKLPLTSIIIGGLFILAGLVLVIIISDISQQAFWIIRVIVSLGAGFVAAGILGNMTFEGTVKNIVIKAGGPIGVTLIMYLVNPPNFMP